MQVLQLYKLDHLATQSFASRVYKCTSETDPTPNREGYRESRLGDRKGEYKFYKVDYLAT
jgi:hypothetical protein